MTACFEYPYRPPQLAEARGEDPSSHAVELEEENMRALEDAMSCGSGGPSFALRLQGTNVAIGTTSVYVPTVAPVGGNRTTWLTGCTRSSAGVIIPQTGVWAVHARLSGTIVTSGVFQNLALNLHIGEATIDEVSNIAYPAAGTYDYVIWGSRLVRFTAGDVFNAWLETTGTVGTSEGNISGSFHSA